MQLKVEADLHDNWMDKTSQAADEILYRALARYQAKYPRVMKYLAKESKAIRALYDFPNEHWAAICTSKPIK